MTKYFISALFLVYPFFIQAKESSGRSYETAEDQKIISNSLIAEYGSKVSKIEFKTLYNPFFQFGNASMKLQPILKKVGGDYVRENEIFYSVQYFLNNKLMDCLATVSDLKGTHKVTVSIGTCNQGMKDIIHWKQEFNRFEDVPLKQKNAEQTSKPGAT